MYLCFVYENIKTWDEFLSPYNTAIHVTTRIQPFQMLYGRNLRLPNDLIFPTETVFHVELEPEAFGRDKEFAMKKVFKFVDKRRKSTAA